MASQGCHSYAVCKRCGDWPFHSKLSSQYCQCGARFSSHHIKLASAACPLFKWGISRPRQRNSYGRNERSNGTAAPEPEAAADEHSLLESAQEEFVAFKKKYSDVLVGDGATCVFKEVKPSPVAACHTAKNKYNRALSVSTKSSHRVIAIQAEIQQLQEQLDEKKKTLVEAQRQAEKAQADLDEAHSAHCAAEAARKAEADAASAARRSGDDQMDTDDPPNVKKRGLDGPEDFLQPLYDTIKGKISKDDNQDSPQQWSQDAEVQTALMAALEGIIARAKASAGVPADGESKVKAQKL